MKKICTIKKGEFYFVIMTVIMCIVLILGLSFLPGTSGILLVCCSILFGLSLFYLYKRHYLNYVDYSEKGISHKDITYSWSEVCITVSYTTPDLVRNAYVYRAYFNTEFLVCDDELKEADKNGFCIDLYEDRLDLILKFYNKKLYVFAESPLQKKLLNRIIEHNKNFE